jgi:hypothetical protein
VGNVDAISPIASETMMQNEPTSSQPHVTATGPPHWKAM